VAVETRRDRQGRLVVAVKVAPRASRDAVLGEHDGALKIAVTAPPVEGAANEAVCRVLARALGLPRGAVEIAGGERSKRKLVALDGCTEEAVTALITRTGRT
jgi:hypothetical protein